MSASWCSQCNVLKNTLEAMGKEYSVIDIDTEEGVQYVERYKVRGIPAMIVTRQDKFGEEEVDIIRGNKTREELEIRLYE